jgi:hypothetical protein
MSRLTAKARAVLEEDAEVAVAEVVGEDEDDVGPGRGGGAEDLREERDGQGGCGCGKHAAGGGVHMW